jgi:hypothetical protein
MVLICLSKTVLTDPGFFSREYINIHSLVIFFKLYFEYILGLDEENYPDLTHKNINNNIFENIAWIVEKKENIIKKINQIKKAFKEYSYFILGMTSKTHWN